MFTPRELQNLASEGSANLLARLLQKPKLVGNLGIQRQISVRSGEISLVDAHYDSADYSRDLVLTIVNESDPTAWFTNASLLKGRIWFGNKGIGTLTPLFDIGWGMSIPIRGNSIRLAASLVGGVNPAAAFPISAFVTEGLVTNGGSSVQATVGPTVVAAGAQLVTVLPKFIKSISVSGNVVPLRVDIQHGSLVLTRQTFAADTPIINLSAGVADGLYITNLGPAGASLTVTYDLTF